MNKLLEELIWILGEAERGYLDPAGTGWVRVNEFLTELVNEVTESVLRRLDERAEAEAASLPVLPMPFDPWEHLRPPSEGTEPR